MILHDLILKCQKGIIGLYPKYNGYFKWNYATNTLDYVNYDGEQFPASNLQDWNKIKNTSDFYYII